MVAEVLDRSGMERVFLSVDGRVTANSVTVAPRRMRARVSPRSECSSAADREGILYSLRSVPRRARLSTAALRVAIGVIFDTGLKRVRRGHTLVMCILAFIVEGVRAGGSGSHLQAVRGPTGP